MTDEHRQWLQQQLTKLLAWDTTVSESIAEGLVNATDDNHVATIFKDFMPNTPAIASLQQQYIAKRAKAFATIAPSPSSQPETKATSTRSGVSVNYRQAPAGKGKGGRSRAAEAPKGAAALAAQLDRRVVNCLGCGKIYHCTQPLSTDAKRFLEAGGVCTFCSKPVALYARGERVVPAGIEVAAQATGDERAAAAMALKERLVEYDRNSAQRTTVVDDQSDYFAIDSNTWLTDEERAALRVQQEAVERAAEARRGRIVVTFDLLGRQVVVADRDEGAPPQGLQEGPAGQSSLFVPSAARMDGSHGSSGQARDAVVDGQFDVSTAEGEALLEGPMRAVINPAAHVVPTFTAPSAAQLARVTVPR